VAERNENRKLGRFYLNSSTLAASKSADHPACRLGKPRRSAALEVVLDLDLQI